LLSMTTQRTVIAGDDLGVRWSFTGLFRGRRRN
jgi:hypothetical protein